MYASANGWRNFFAGSASSTRGATFGVATSGRLTNGLVTTGRGAAMCVDTDIIGRLTADGLKIIGALMTAAVTAAMMNTLYLSTVRTAPPAAR